jgi:hypothetical protein
MLCCGRARTDSAVSFFKNTGNKIKTKIGTLTKGKFRRRGRAKAPIPKFDKTYKPSLMMQHSNTETWICDDFEGELGEVKSSNQNWEKMVNKGSTIKNDKKFKTSVTVEVKN